MGKRTSFFITLPTKKSVKFIQHIKNGEFTETTPIASEFFFSTIEDAIVGTEALKTMATLQEQKMEDITHSSSSVGDAIEKT